MFSFLGLVRKHCEKYAIDTGLDFFFSLVFILFLAVLYVKQKENKERVLEGLVCLNFYSCDAGFSFSTD